MKVFTSKDLEEALDIYNREQIYLVDKGYIEADIRSDKPRIFSPRQAIYAKLIHDLQGIGYTWEMAGRIGRLLGASILSIVGQKSTQAQGIDITAWIDYFSCLVCGTMKQGDTDEKILLRFAISPDVESDTFASYAYFSCDVGSSGLISEINLSNYIKTVFEKIAISDSEPILEDSRVTIKTLERENSKWIGFTTDKYMAE